MILFQEGDPFQDLRVSTCLIFLSVELSEETHRLTDFIGKKYLEKREARQGGPRTVLPCGWKSRVLW